MIDACARPVYISLGTNCYTVAGASPTNEHVRCTSYNVQLYVHTLVTTLHTANARTEVLTQNATAHYAETTQKMSRCRWRTDGRMDGLQNRAALPTLQLTSGCCRRRRCRTDSYLPTCPPRLTCSGLGHCQWVGAISKQPPVYTDSPEQGLRVSAIYTVSTVCTWAAAATRRPGIHRLALGRNVSWQRHDYERL